MKIIETLLLGGLLNCDARLKETGKGYDIIGDPTEGALVVAAAKAGFSREAVDADSPRLAEIPFDSERKMMTTFHRLNGSIRSFTKGAPDVVLGRCTSVMTRDATIALKKKPETALEVNAEFVSGVARFGPGHLYWPDIPIASCRRT